MPNHPQDQCRKNSSRTLRETLFFLIITSSRLQGHFSLRPAPLSAPTNLRAPTAFRERPPAITLQSFIEMLDFRERKRR
ncbi:hypothetical protein CEXT_495851 [Caerostris extrusa]|uniref:Uncharacterized protein n=1 Tax=Caerostris extrusa TaxID=172846 RepID=A0AAV4R396_CAEEX|nr:hypothetical protein CEXT_495851 [Caerostris extrusa]